MRQLNKAQLNTVSGGVVTLKTSSLNNTCSYNAHFETSSGSLYDLSGFALETLTRRANELFNANYALKSLEAQSNTAQRGAFGARRNTQVLCSTSNKRGNTTPCTAFVDEQR